MQTHVWYFSYGSNINLIRFLYYIKGGKLGNRSYDVNVSSKPSPQSSRRAIIPYSLILNKWAYISDQPTRDRVFGRMYQITEEQLMEVVRLEGYNQVKLGTYEGLAVFAVNVKGKTTDQVYQDYKALLVEALRKFYDDDAVESYIKKIESVPVCGIHGHYENINMDGLDVTDRAEIMRDIEKLDFEAKTHPIAEIV